MSPHDDDRIDQRMSRFLSAAGNGGTPPDEAFLARLREQSAEAFMAASAQGPARSRRYRIMHSRTIKFLIPAAVAAAVVGVVGFWPGGKGGGVVLAEVVRRLRSAHTVTCRTDFHVKGEVIGTAEYMFMGDHLTRVATPDGLVCIMDGSSGRGIILDARRKTAAAFEGIPHRFDFYKALMEFRDGAETPLGRRQIDGREAVGFLLGPKAGSVSIWVDARTQLPVRMEQKTAGPDGAEQIVIARDFVLDAPLDPSLFSLAVPEGYVEGRVRLPAVEQKLQGKTGGEGDAAEEGRYVSAADRAKELGLRMRSATALRKILVACLRYAAEHGGQWPDDLRSLEGHGIDAADLVNPRRPDNASGWVYRRPAAPANGLGNAPGTVVVHEELDPWNEGVNVGFADGHVEFVKDRKRLDTLLKQ